MSFGIYYGNKSNLNWTKESFTLEMYRLAGLMRLNVRNPKSWPKEKMFKLLNIKLDQGETAMRSELNRMMGR